jgi:hypothetical protein
LRPHHCANCGYSSAMGPFFRKGEAGLLHRKVMICAGCSSRYTTDLEEKLTDRFWTGQIVWGVLLTLGLALSFVAHSSVGLVGVTFYAAIVVSIPTRIAIHEAGHALAAVALGLRVLKVEIGSGPLLATFRLSDTQIEVRQKFYLGGMTKRALGRRERSRARTALVVLAGPASDLAAAMLILWCAYLVQSTAGEHPSTLLSMSVAGLCGVGLAEGSTAIRNLRPSRFRDGTASDGQQLLDLLRRRQPLSGRDEAHLQIIDLIAMGRFGEAAELAECAASESTSRVEFLSMAIHCRSRADGDLAALDFYAKSGCGAADASLETDESSRAAIAWLRANLAWCAIKADQVSWTRQADSYSESALEIVPTAPEMKGTRGAWLIRHGHVKDGLDLLTEAVRNVADPLDRAEFCRFLSLGHRNNGDLIFADEFENLGRHLLSSTPPRDVAN